VNGASNAPPQAILTQIYTMSKVWFITGTTRGLGRALTKAETVLNLQQSAQP